MNTPAIQGGQKQVTIRSVLSDEKVKARFSEIMKNRAPAFMTSILNVSDSTPALSAIGRDNPMSIIRCAAVAAALDLPIEKSLGFAWIVPYGKEAQFQIGWKGLVQLSLRTGQYTKLSVTQVNEGCFRSYDSMREVLDADCSPVGIGRAMGFVVYFKLLNGFEKIAYFSKDQLLDHGKRFSKTFQSGPWKDHQDAMCAKTALKLTLTKWGIMSTEMRRATMADQAVVTGDDIDSEGSFGYEDATDAEYSEVKSTKPVVESTKNMKVEQPIVAAQEPVKPEEEVNPTKTTAAPVVEATNEPTPRQKFEIVVDDIASQAGIHAGKEISKKFGFVLSKTPEDKFAEVINFVATFVK